MTAETERTVSKPDPDPSIRANESLFREIDALDKRARGWIDALQLLLESRLAGMEGRTNEKFSSIQTQFRERDVRTDQTASQVKLAVDAALQAQKEAAGEQAKSFSAATFKSETAMNKQIEGLDGKISDVKERISRAEAMGVGMSSNRSNNQTEESLRQHGSQNMISIIAVAVGLLSILTALGGVIYTATRPSSLAPSIVYAQPPAIMESKPGLQRQSDGGPLPLWPPLYSIGERR